MFLNVYYFRYVVFFSKPSKCSISVLQYTLWQVTCYTHIKNSIPFVSHYVDVIFNHLLLFIPRHCEERSDAAISFFDSLLPLEIPTVGLCPPSE